MRRYPKKVVLSIPYEWYAMLDNIKKDKFINASRAEMLRYIIGRSLDSIKTNRYKNETLDRHNKI